MSQTHEYCIFYLYNINFKYKSPRKNKWFQIIIIFPNVLFTDHPLFVHYSVNIYIDNWHKIWCMQAAANVIFIILMSWSFQSLSHRPIYATMIIYQIYCPLFTPDNLHVASIIVAICPVLRYYVNVSRPLK